MLSLRRPTAEAIQAFQAQARLNLTYAAVGATATPPPGYVVDHTRIKLGDGEKVFIAAKTALEWWEPFWLGWLEVRPEGAPIKDREDVSVWYDILAFFTWLSAWWQGWPLPILFFTVKSFLGNRILELCSLRSEQLQEGRIVFAADEVKGRKERKALLLPDVYDELKSLAGANLRVGSFPGATAGTPQDPGQAVYERQGGLRPRSDQVVVSGRDC